MGTIVNVAAAPLFPQSTEIEPTNFEIPTGNVYVSRPVNCRAKRSSFQENCADKIVEAARPGRIIGTT